MKKGLIYTAYIVFVTIFFLYYLFPGEALTKYINYQVSGISSDVKFSIQDIGPDFPPGIKIDVLEVNFQNQVFAGADVLQIFPSYLSLASPEKTFSFKGKTYQGSLNGTVSVSQTTSNNAIAIDAAFQDIQISDIPVVKKLESYQVKGLGQGTIVFNNKESSYGKGNADIKISDSSIKFNPSLFGVEQLSFSSVNAELEMENKLLKIKNLDFESKDLTGNVTGTISLRQPVDKSLINISGEIKPHPSFIKQMGSIFPIDLISNKKNQKGAIPFRVTGSFDRPNFSLR